MGAVTVKVESDEVMQTLDALLEAVDAQRCGGVLAASYAIVQTREAVRKLLDTARPLPPLATVEHDSLPPGRVRFPVDPAQGDAAYPIQPTGGA